MNTSDQIKSEIDIPDCYARFLQACLKADNQYIEQYIYFSEVKTNMR